MRSLHGIGTRAGTARRRCSWPNPHTEVVARGGPLAPHSPHLSLHIDRSPRRTWAAAARFRTGPVAALEMPGDAVWNEARALRASRQAVITVEGDENETMDYRRVQV